MATELPQLRCSTFDPRVLRVFRAWRGVLETAPKPLIVGHAPPRRTIDAPIPWGSKRSTGHFSKKGLEGNGVAAASLPHKSGATYRRRVLLGLGSSSSLLDSQLQHVTSPWNSNSGAGSLGAATAPCAAAKLLAAALPAQCAIILLKMAPMYSCRSSALFYTSLAKVIHSSRRCIKILSASISFGKTVRKE